MPLRDRGGEAWSRYTRAHQRQREAAGRCIRCGKLRGPSHFKQWCQPCGEAHRRENREHHRRTTEERLAAGVCIYCGAPRDTPRSERCCLRCLDFRKAMPSQARNHGRRSEERERKRVLRARQRMECDLCGGSLRWWPKWNSTQWRQCDRCWQIIWSEVADAAV